MTNQERRQMVNLGVKKAPEVTYFLWATGIYISKNRKTPTRYFRKMSYSDGYTAGGERSLGPANLIGTRINVVGDLVLTQHGNGGYILRHPEQVEITATGATTVTAAQLFSGFLTYNPAASGVATWTLPTAALLKAAIPNCAVGDVVKGVYIINKADSHALTIAAGAGCTLDSTGSGETMAATSCSKLELIIKSVTAGAETYHALLVNE